MSGSLMRFFILTITMLLVAKTALPITPDQGWEAVEEAVRAGEKEILLGEGLFLLADTAALGGEWSGVRLVGAGEDTIISGAVETGSWEKVSADGDLWRCQSPLSRDEPVRQLFEVEGGRLPRSRMPNTGWYRGDRLSTIDFDVNRVATRDVANGWRVTRPDVFAGLRFREEDREDLAMLIAKPEGAVMQTISAWTSAWHPVRKIDHETGDVTLYTPSRYPLVHWSYGVNEGGGTPYAIENTEAGIDLEREWYWNPTENTLTLKSDGDPNEHRFLVPALETVLEIDGVEDLELSNLQIAHSRSRFGRYDQHADWAAAIRAWDPTFPAEFPQGLTVPQSAPFTGEAIHVTNSRQVKLVGCWIAGTGGYGLRLGTNSHDCVIERCRFDDLGAGGISIDPEIRKAETDYPTGHLVKGNTIVNGGRLHPAACAIRVAESADNRIEGNEIRHFGYTGISIGWAWNPRPNRTTGNLIIGNDISHVMEVLSDGAGIYTLGSIPGTRIEDNFIHDIGRAETAVGAGNSGIFFDQYSKGAMVRNNRLERIDSWKAEDERVPHPIKHHRNLPEDHTFEGNTVDGAPYEPAGE
ncbi:MAG: right-handed parallel beta-helix repeat-containing protein [Verrucomicrobiota bacterium]